MEHVPEPARTENKPPILARRPFSAATARAHERSPQREAPAIAGRPRPLSASAAASRQRKETVPRGPRLAALQAGQKTLWREIRGESPGAKGAQRFMELYYEDDGGLSEEDSFPPSPLQQTSSMLHIGLDLTPKDILSLAKQLQSNDATWRHVNESRDQPGSTTSSASESENPKTIQSTPDIEFYGIPSTEFAQRYLPSGQTCDFDGENAIEEASCYGVLALDTPVHEPQAAAMTRTTAELYPHELAFLLAATRTACREAAEATS